MVKTDTVKVDAVKVHTVKAKIVRVNTVILEKGCEFCTDPQKLDLKI